MSMQRGINMAGINATEDDKFETKEDFIKRNFTHKECQVFIPIETEGSATL